MVLSRFCAFSWPRQFLQAMSKFNAEFVISHLEKSCLGDTDVDLREYIAAYRELNKYVLLNIFWNFLKNTSRQRKFVRFFFFFVFWVYLFIIFFLFSEDLLLKFLLHKIKKNRWTKFWFSIFRLFALLGKLFAFVKIDVEEKEKILEDYCREDTEHYATVGSMTAWEIQDGVPPQKQVSFVKNRFKPNFGFSFSPSHLESIWSVQKLLAIFEEKKIFKRR